MWSLSECELISSSERKSARAGTNAFFQLLFGQSAMENNLSIIGHDVARAAHPFDIDRRKIESRAARRRKN
jgi:hypothetical protein